MLHTSVCVAIALNASFPNSLSFSLAIFSFFNRFISLFFFNPFPFFLFLYFSPISLFTLVLSQLNSILYKMEQKPADVTSPTLEALCHDLDMFINELSVNSSSKTETTHMKRLNKDITPLELDKTLV